MTSDGIARASPDRFGSTWRADHGVWDILLPAPRATAVELVLHEDPESAAILRRPMAPVRTPHGRAWWARVPEADAGDAAGYGFHVHGPRPGDADHQPFDCFDPDRRLLDPWGRAIQLAATVDGPPLSLFVREPWPGREPPADSPAHAPAHSAAPAAAPPFHRTPTADLVIQELHVRGFTRDPSSGVPPAHRGTYLGVIDRIPSLVALGITAVELMPVFQFDPREPNYWGYMPLGFLAVHAAYATDGTPRTARREFREMVAALHAAGIEVLLDVVYNHTAEGGEDGRTTSLRGIDQSAFYLADASGRHPADLTGCHNTIDVTRPLARRLIIDSLRWWRAAMGVDGFRFDLAAVLARGEAIGTDRRRIAPLFDEIRQDPLLRSARLIAEPWDAAGTMLLGRRFPGPDWMQWNAAYRDTLQAFIAGRPGTPSDLAARVYGSRDLFADADGESDGHRRSINHIVSHDGSTLRDLVTYEQRHNLANGNDDLDGPTEIRWNGGHEGPDASPTILRVRGQRVRTALTILMCSAGVPMLRMGDEFGQTQAGNTNPYRLDDASVWLDWTLERREAGLLRFVRRLIAARRSLPAITRAAPWGADVSWLGPGGPADFSPASRCLGWCLAAGRHGGPDVLVFANGDDCEHPVPLPAPRPGGWRRLVDTAQPSPADILDQAGPVAVSEGSITVAPQSAIVLLSGPPARPGTPPP